jgi:lytic murein transglycosylase
MKTGLATISLWAVAVLLVQFPSGGFANTACGDGEHFEAWLTTFKQDAAKQGISPTSIAAASPFLRYERSIIDRDRSQRFFGQDFVTFSSRIVLPYRLTKGAQLIRHHAGLLRRIEREFGVPGPVLVAFWGLESDFGADNGKLPVLRSLVTLAHDCRRSDLFREQLMAALSLIERGDLAPADMLGDWAGELGQLQFLPTLYVNYAVDYDGDGKRDLIGSIPDALASSANYLRDLGWRRGEPWLQEVRVPKNLPWEQADLSIQHPRAQWKRWGVSLANGRPLENDALAASLLLPMGRFGPAFLAYENFKAFQRWNNSLVYATTSAYYATRLAGAPALRRVSSSLPLLNSNEVRELQGLLVRMDLDVGNIDGILGVKTRAAVKILQQRFGLPADSWPTPEFMTRLRSQKGL